MTGDDADVRLVLAFLNTLDVEDQTDTLRDKDSWAGWAREHGLRPGPLGAARTARAALRAAIDSASPGPESPGHESPGAESAGAEAAVTVRLGPSGPELAADTAVAAVFAAAVRLALRGDWTRMKLCPAHDCRWAFYDRSRNRSRTWCDMRICGNRQKARAHRARTP